MRPISYDCTVTFTESEKSIIKKLINELVVTHSDLQQSWHRSTIPRILQPKVYAIVTHSVSKVSENEINICYKVKPWLNPDIHLKYNWWAPVYRQFLWTIVISNMYENLCGYCHDQHDLSTVVRDHSSEYGLSQWEVTLQSNIISHWLNPDLLWSLAPTWNILLLLENSVLPFIMTCFQVYGWKFQQTQLQIRRLLMHWGWDKMAAILEMTFSYEFSSMKIFIIWSKFHWTLFTRVQLSICQYWFR